MKLSINLFDHNLNKILLLGLTLVIVINLAQCMSLTKTEAKEGLMKSLASEQMGSQTELKKKMSHKKAKMKMKMKARKQENEYLNNLNLHPSDNNSQTPQAQGAANNTATDTSNNATTNATKIKLSHLIYEKLNTTFYAEELNSFKSRARTWDLKLLDKQLEDIYQDMNYRTELKNTPHGINSFLSLFVSDFEACDKDFDYMLNLQEFEECMKTDIKLKEIIPPRIEEATFRNYSYTNSTGFYSHLFRIMDSNNNNNLSFHDYMTLRLFAFSWKKCSPMRPLIEEVNFECAVEIASGYHTLQRTTLRRIYTLALEIGNNENVREIDFITFTIVAVSVRLYGKINGKEDNDITRSEMNLALDSNILPVRYNQEIVDDLFTLIAEWDKPSQGMDLLSFVFYDFFLRIYEVPALGQQKLRKYWLSEEDLLATILHYLFPIRIIEELKRVPRVNLTRESYNMYMYINKYLYHEEADHLFKSFLESSKVENLVTPKDFRFKSKNNALKKRIVGNFDLLAKNFTTLFTFDPKIIAKNLFKILDGNGDGWLNFYDWGNFIQIGYLYTKFDPLFKGRITAGELYEKYNTYSDFPVVSRTLIERSKRFSLFQQDLYVDLLHATLVLRIDDLVKSIIRRPYSMTLYEFELKHIFTVVSMHSIPDSYLNKCLRGADMNSVPLYEWECSFTEVLSKTLYFYEVAYAYLTTKSMNLHLHNTVFVNEDPGL